MVARPHQVEVEPRFLHMVAVLIRATVMANGRNSKFTSQGFESY